MGRRKKIVYEPPIILKENGIQTIRSIALDEDMQTLHTVFLNDGDQVAIRTHVAQGILMIQNNLKEENAIKMDKMELLSLLHVYEEAVKDGVLTPPRLKLYKDIIKA